MDKKEKIKLLTHFSNALESEELQSAVLATPSGELIWQLLEQALNAKIDSLLSDEDSEVEFLGRVEACREELEKNIGELSQKLSAIEKTPAMSILLRVAQIAGAKPDQPAAAPQQNGTPAAPANPASTPVRRNPGGRESSVAGMI